MGQALALQLRRLKHVPERIKRCSRQLPHLAQCVHTARQRQPMNIIKTEGATWITSKQEVYPAYSPLRLFDTASITSWAQGTERLPAKMTSRCPMGEASDQEPTGANEEVAKQAAAAGTATAAAVVVPLLHALTCSDNAARNQAEQAFNNLKEGQPEDIVYGLLEVSGGNSLLEQLYREYCAITTSGSFVCSRTITHTRDPPKPLKLGTARSAGLAAIGAVLDGYGQQGSMNSSHTAGVCMHARLLSWSYCLLRRFGGVCHGVDGQLSLIMQEASALCPSVLKFPFAGGGTDRCPRMHR